MKDSTLISRVHAASVEPHVFRATWWMGRTGAWKEAPGRPPPPHKITDGWAPFLGALREASRLDLTDKGAGPAFCLADMDRGYRGKAHVETVYGLTVDIDDAGADVDAVRAWFDASGLAYLMQIRAGKVHIHVPIDPITGRERFVSAARVFLGELAAMWPGVDLSMSRPEQACYAYARVGGSPVSTTERRGYALDLLEWETPGAAYGPDRVPARDYLLAAAGQWIPGDAPLTKAAIAACNEPHRSILRACLAGEAPALEEGTRNASLHAAVWSLAAADPGLDPARVAAGLVLGAMLLDRTAEFADPEWWRERYETAAREIGVRRAAQAAEDADKGGDWYWLVTRTKDGGVAPAGTNATLIACHDPDIAPALGWDVFADRAVVMPGRELPWGGAKGPRALVPEAEWAGAARWFRETPRVGALFPRGAVIDALEAGARAGSFDPLETYLRGLKWDGVPRAHRWLHDHLGADGSEIVSEMGRRWLISAVARGLRPGCQVDSALVLQGAQGLGKTSAFRLLARGWYTDRIGDPKDKDSMAELQGSWIVEIAELESLRHVDMARLKGFLTRSEDVYRAPYARTAVARPRRCVFGASTNQDHYLSDPTGARRWWPVTVRRHLDQAAFAAVVDQLWAEAVVLLEKGEPWHLPTHLLRAAEEAADERREGSPWEDAITAWAPTEPFTIGDAYTALGVDKSNNRAAYQIRDALRALGYTRRRPRGGADRRRLWFRWRDA